MILVNVAAAWLVYEIGVGVQVIRGEHFSYGKKRPMVTPSILFARDRENYLEWRKRKGDLYK